MAKIARHIHRYLFLIVCGFWYGILWLPLNYFAQTPSRYPGMIRTRRLWAKLCTWCAGIFFRFEFEAPIDFHKPYIICPLHTSDLDTMMICLIIPHRNYSIIGKQELLDGVVTGIFFRTVDISVNRESKLSAYRAFKSASEKLKEGKSIVIFPEGGIAEHYPPRVQEFKSGPFKLAIELQIPILPVTSLNTWKLMSDDGSAYGTRPGVCSVFVHKPVETAGLKSSDEESLRRAVYELIRRKFNQ